MEDEQKTKEQLIRELAALRQHLVELESAAQQQQATEVIQQQTQRELLVARMSQRIRQSLQLEAVLSTTVVEVRQCLQADRVFIYRFELDWGGAVIVESVVPEWTSILGSKLKDPSFAPTFVQLYKEGRVQATADIYAGELTECYVEFLAQFQVRAALVVPILQADQLWGLLVVNQCVAPRQWQQWEINLLRQLATQLAIALQQAELYQQLQSELEERHKAEQELKRQQQLLAQSNSDLQQFASVASHDLQELLRKIQVFGNQLKEKFSEVLGAQGRDYIERMQSAVGRMQSLIDDLLAFARIATRAQPFGATNLEQVVQEVLSDLEVRLQQTEGKVEVDKLPTIDADPVQMRQLFQNLIGNALKFHRPQTPPAVKIYSQLVAPLQSEAEDSEDVAACQVIVADNGIGFEPKYQERIFQAFQRLHGRSQYEGTGIGLAICRKITERHGGSIKATSMPGQGATFIVTLPMQHQQQLLDERSL
ncbi:MAG: Adaptive-response sensory-kinase SasA [Chroococcidiopsis sp. SAG 2025]|uniref:sensor histidine kinase n=1 Tax=Chroococcidiopsis sp. SAG 2025 TaxID=171389 RepID=UPI0029372106|nr:ATP-binding protein [Chroococcidiopsis sp. SAG 2025]MDV2997044.1 Adaptive-response sensory-kinase SasA [Chroococcidiopsis sp. SAG 2025]